MNPTQSYTYVNSTPGSYTNPQTPQATGYINAPDPNTAINNAPGILPTSGVQTTQPNNGVNQNISLMGQNYDLSTSAGMSAYRNAINNAPGNKASERNINTPSATDVDTSERDQISRDLFAKGQAVSNTIDQIANGSIPLNAGEQAQVDELKRQFNQMIDQQRLVNTGAEGTANIRGYQKGAAEYDPTFQAKIIGTIVSTGQAKIADLNVRMAGAVAQLTESLRANDIANIQKAYGIYEDASKERIDTLNQTISQSQKAIKDANDAYMEQQKLQLDQANDIRNYNEKVREFDVSSQADKNKLALDYAKLSYQKQTDAGSGIDTSGLSNEGLDMLARGYLTSGVLPSIGYGNAAMTVRTAIINRAVQLAGGNDNIDPAANKATYDANKADLKKQTGNYSTAQIAYNIFDQNGQFALQLAQGLNKHNSPIINQLNNLVINERTQTGQLDSFRAVITSLQSEYATLINVKGGSGGAVTEGDKAKAAAAIPMDISPARLQEVLANLKIEGENVLKERSAYINYLKDNLNASASSFNQQTSSNPLIGQIVTAQSLGHGPKEIIDTISTNPQYASSVAQARAAGYTDEEIISFLSQQK